MDTDRPEEVFAHACVEGDWAILALHNLGGEALTGVRVRLWEGADYDCAIYLFEDRDSWDLPGRELCVDLAPRGFYRLRLRRR